MNRLQNAGFTTLETLVVVAIVAILTALALPSYEEMIERNRLKEVIEAFKSDLQFAKTEAMKLSQDVVVSRTPGAAGTWCYGLNAGAACDCAIAGSCSIRTVSGSNFSSAVTMNDADVNNSTFDFRRGTIGAGGVTFSTDSYSARVVFSNVGRVRVCIPAGATGFSDYPDC